MRKLIYSGSDKFKIRASEIINALRDIVIDIPNVYQRKLTPGEGITIDENNVISSNSKDLGLVVVDGKLCVEYEEE